MSFKLPTHEEKHDFVQAQFERIASKYDLTNDVISLGMHRFWKKEAVSALTLKENGHYLDVCTGTGDLALAIGEHLSNKGSVSGVDFSANMLNIAKSRVSKARRNNSISCEMLFKEADAQILPFEDQTFDGAVISFGLRNLSDFKQGLREMVRVVKRGGKIVNLDLGSSNMPVFSNLFNMYFENIVPLIGQILQKDRSAYTYLPQSRSLYLKPRELELLFQEIGLEQVTYMPLALGSVALHVGVVQ
jgi:demethylmenaquinone methyltransferase/2-methoxy-6-polyprenyl-1,4-benzoquinol methylase